MPLTRPSTHLAATLAVMLAACAGTPEPERVPDPQPPPVVTPARTDTVAPPRRPPPAADTVRRPEPEPPPVEAGPAEPAPLPPMPKAAPGTPPLRGWDRRADAVLPARRIVAFYGNPQSRNMGILGELPPDQMLARLDAEVEAWQRADPDVPVQPALHLIATMAAADPGPDSLYRLRQPARVIDRVIEWAERRDAIVFLDIQTGRSSVEAELPRLERWLRRPDVHLALDPEWSVPAPHRPGQVIGSMRARDVNVAVRWLAEIVQEHGLPPKVLVVHRFTQAMLRDPGAIVQDPRVQVVLNMDGWGPPQGKRASYRNFVASAPVPHKGFKLFYKNDRRGGSRLMTPAEVLELEPVPFYIQYQ